MARAKRQVYPRKILIVNPGFQWKYAFLLAGVVLVVSSVLSAVLYGTLHQQAKLQAGVASPRSMNIAFFLFLAGIAFSVVTTGAVTFWCLVATHRMCGPLFVMTRALRELADGRIPMLRPLRKKDDFKDFYLVFSEAMDVLKTRREAEVAALSEAVELLEEVETWDEPLQERVEKLAAELNRLKRSSPRAERPKDPVASSA